MGADCPLNLHAAFSFHSFHSLSCLRVNWGSSLVTPSASDSLSQQAFIPFRHSLHL